MGPQKLPSFLIMMQTKTKTVLSMGRIPQLFGHAVLAAGVLAGGASVLNAGGAVAEISCGEGYFLYPGTSVPPAVPTCVSPLADNPKLVNVDHDYPTPQPFNANGLFEYRLTSTEEGNFIGANIDADIDAFGSYSFTFTKDVYKTQADLDANDPALATRFTFTNIDGVITVDPSGGGPLVGYGSEVWVRDIWQVSGAAEVDNITNTFQTPGPLPILGAGAAFGFSRKLRGRIKAARLG
jgi:hypothetical protein